MAKQIVPIQMYATASGDSAANIDVPADGDIIGYAIFLSGNTIDAGGDGIESELSFGSSNQLTTNDARNVIGSHGILGNDIQTAETFRSSDAITISFHGDGIPVAAGERIHMHIKVTGGAVIKVVRAILYFRFAGTLRVRRR